MVRMISEVVDYECNAFFNGLLSKESLRIMIYNYLSELAPDVSSTASALVDSKIEQALDLVRSTLMSTLCKEVVDLRQNLALLNARIKQLELENQFLRKKVEPDTIEALEILLAQKSAEKAQSNEHLAIENKPLPDDKASD